MNFAVTVLKILTLYMLKESSIFAKQSQASAPAQLAGLASLNFI